MNTRRNLHARPLLLTSSLALVGLLFVQSASGSTGQDADPYRRLARRMTAGTLTAISIEGDACARTTRIALRASVRGALEDFDLKLAQCVNLTDPDEISECLEEAIEELGEDLELVDDQLSGREVLCSLLGGGVYEPDIDPQNFVTGITNPLFPFQGTSTWTYQKQTAEGLEEIFVSLTGDTKDILGITCTEVRDVVTLDGVLIEDTFDWYAQDVDGNVWYMGEIAMNYEEGELSDLDGSWVAGIDGALPGIVMHDAPVVGTTYRQEWWLTEAEDAATVMDTNATVTIGFGGTYTGCLETFDFTPLEPDAQEFKYYAPGIGLILETNPEGERTELVAFP